MSHESSHENTDSLYIAGGLALMVLGAGLLAASPALRRIVQSRLPELTGHDCPGTTNGLGLLLPDFERYFKIRSM